MWSVFWKEDWPDGAGGPASDPSSVRPQLESTFAQPAGPVKLLLYFGSERSGMVIYMQ